MRTLGRTFLAGAAILLFCILGKLDTLCCNEDCPEDDSWRTEK